MAKFGVTKAAIYEFIKEYYEANGIPPTVREIGAALGLKSTSTVHAHLRALADEGLINMKPTKQRSITVAEIFAPVHETAQLRSGKTENGMLRIPLVGRVAAGLPILAVENITEYYTVSPALLRGASNDDVFMLTVSGESMIDVGINDGDTIIIDRGKSVSNGDIVVARVNADTATVKRLFINKDGTVRLQPENRTMPPIIVKQSDCEIIGRLIGLYRSY